MDFHSFHSGCFYKQKLLDVYYNNECIVYYCVLNRTNHINMIIFISVQSLILTFPLSQFRPDRRFPSGRHETTRPSYSHVHAQR